jgi:hypothetical protein
MKIECVDYLGCQLLKIGMYVVEVLELVEAEPHGLQFGVVLLVGVAGVGALQGECA